MVSLIISIVYKLGLLSIYVDNKVIKSCQRISHIPGPEDLVEFNDNILITASYDRLTGKFKKRDSLSEGELYAINTNDGSVKKIKI